MRHGCGGNAQDARGRLGAAQAQRLGNVSAHGALGRSQVELHLAAKKVLWVQAAEQHVGVCHGGRCAAQAIAGRTGAGACALRAHPQRAGAAQAGQAAAAGADLVDIDHRGQQRQAALVAADHHAVGHQRLKMAHHTGLGCGAAHVEGNRVFNAQRGA